MVGSPPRCGPTAAGGRGLVSAAKARTARTARPPPRRSPAAPDSGDAARSRDPWDPLGRHRSTARACGSGPARPASTCGRPGCRRRCPRPGLWCARLTGEGQPVEVRRKEGVTNHFRPESCAGRCEAAGEALTGARTGRAIEHRKRERLERRDCHSGRRQHRHHRNGEGMAGSCARLTGEGQPVKVRRKEGITNHLHPESCAGRCEAAGEALTGARTGRAIEHRKAVPPASDGVQRCLLLRESRTFASEGVQESRGRPLRRVSLWVSISGRWTRPGS